ncbi:MAG: hypothetical protein KatS3mg124_0542 [Porticoccaceae bacterium]|nr:MAG: hypothetical protein KatS3mg124_0542 [Porticoccaceae bacterium]
MRAPLGLLFVLFALPGAALDLFGREEAARRFPEGAQLYERHCAACHDRGDARTPSASLLFDMAPEAVLAALTDGPMRAQGAALSPAERRAVAEFLTNRRLEPRRARAEPRCEGAAARFDFSAPPPFWNWGLDRGGRHFVPGAVAGIHRDNVARLRLRWVHAFPGSQRMRSQPALAGGAVIAGSHAGRVRALDLETGCLRWEFRADAEVRTAVVVSPWPAGDASARPLAYFGDLRANVYAVDAATGRLVWKARLDDHPAAVITGAPALHRGVLYVPVSSLEEAAAAAPGYPCCTFRGAVAALDAASGRLLWRTFLVPEPRPRPPPGPAFGPSGVAVWMSPTVDEARGLLFVATGDNYSDPATELPDAVVALDLKSGAIRWHRQLLAGDAWNVDCFARLAGNCPEEAGPDHDFGAGLILAPAPGGRELLFAGQKSGGRLRPRSSGRRARLADPGGPGRTCRRHRLRHGGQRRAALRAGLRPAPVAPPAPSPAAGFARARPRQRPPPLVRPRPRCLRSASGLRARQCRHPHRHRDAGLRAERGRPPARLRRRDRRAPLGVRHRPGMARGQRRARTGRRHQRRRRPPSLAGAADRRLRLRLCRPHVGQPAHGLRGGGSPRSRCRQ